MEDKYQNKYHIASARWQQWDYGWDAAYFITICTKDRLHHFGEIADSTMDFAPPGVIADVFWHEIKNHAKNIGLGAFVVMPNHIHGILILDGNGDYVAVNRGDIDGNDVQSNVDRNVDQSDDQSVETRHALSLPQTPPQTPQSPSPENRSPGQRRFRNQGKNTISSILGGYKSAVTKHARRMGFEFGWQAGFHDHVIRDGPEFVRITNYILNNPKNWKEDRFYD